jgi:hypothetical protein
MPAYKTTFFGVGDVFFTSKKRGTDYKTMVVYAGVYGTILRGYRKGRLVLYKET